MEPREEVKLLPCPFCGGEAEAFEYPSKTGFRAQCNKYNKCVVTAVCDGISMEEAVKQWNTRPNPVDEKTSKWFKDGCPVGSNPVETKGLDENEVKIFAREWLGNDEEYEQVLGLIHAICSKFSTPTQPQGKKLTAEEIEKVIDGLLSPNYMPGHTNTGHSLSKKEIAQAIAKAQES